MEVAMELARRMHAHWAAPMGMLSTPACVAAWAMQHLCQVLHEELWVVGLNARHENVAAGCVARGGLHSVSVSVPEVLRLALRFGVSQFVLVHNHPSGDPTPSADDLRLTELVQRACKEVGIELADHVVVAGASYVSMYESGYLSASRELHVPSQLR